LPERTTDEVLLQRAGQGDQVAFLELYDRYRDPIFRFAYRLLGSIEIAEDITHDCFLSLIKKPENFRPERASLRTYLLAAARNLWLKQLRTSSRESGVEEFEEGQFISADREPLDRLLDDELSEKVRAAVSSLPPLQKEALVLFEYEGLALSEIAASDLRGENVHTGCRNGSNPMDFDYRLKPGVTNEANALLIARMAGVPI